MSRVGVVSCPQCHVTVNSLLGLKLHRTKRHWWNGYRHKGVPVFPNSQWPIDPAEELCRCGHKQKEHFGGEICTSSYGRTPCECQGFEKRFTHKPGGRSPLDYQHLSLDDFANTTKTFRRGRQQAFLETLRSTEGIPGEDYE